MHKLYWLNSMVGKDYCLLTFLLKRYLFLSEKKTLRFNPDGTAGSGSEIAEWCGLIRIRVGKMVRPNSDPNYCNWIWIRIETVSERKWFRMWALIVMWLKLNVNIWLKKAGSQDYWTLYLHTKNLWNCLFYRYDYSTK